MKSMNPGHLRKVVSETAIWNFRGHSLASLQCSEIWAVSLVLQIAMCLNLGSKKRSLQGINGWEFTTWFRDFGLNSNTKLKNFNGWLGSKRVFLTSWIQTLGSSKEFVQIDVWWGVLKIVQKIIIVLIWCRSWSEDPQKVDIRQKSKGKKTSFYCYRRY